MDKNQLKQIISKIIEGLEAKIESLSNEIKSVKENSPTIESVLANVEIKTPEYGKDWSFSEEEIEDFINKIRPEEGVDYFIPKDGKDAVVTDELIERIAGMVQARVKNGKDGRDGVDGIDGKNGENGIDGVDGSPDSPKEIVVKLNTLENQLDWKVLKDFNSLVNQDTLKRAIDTLENQTRYLIQKTASLTGGGTGGGGTPSNPLNSVQYNLAGAFGGDALFTRNVATGEFSVAGALGASPFDISSVNVGTFFGAVDGAYLSHDDVTNSLTPFHFAGELSAYGLASGAISGVFGTLGPAGNNVNAVYTYTGTNYICNILATNGNNEASVGVSNNSAKIEFTDSSTTVITNVKADSANAILTWDDGTSYSVVKANVNGAQLQYSPNGTNTFTAKVSNGIFDVFDNSGNVFLDIDTVADTYSIGDINGATNGNFFQINNNTENTTLETPNFDIDYGADRYLHIDGGSANYGFGGVSGGNGTYLNINDDASKAISLIGGTTTEFQVIGSAKYFAFDVSGGGSESYVTGGNLDNVNAPVGIVYTAYDNNQASDGNGANVKVRGSTGSGTGQGGSVILQTFQVGTFGSGQQNVVQDVLTLNYQKSAIFIGRIQGKMGANIAAANDLLLGYDGNTFTITGNTQINGIQSQDWQAGSEVTLIFTGTPTVKHNTGGGAGYAALLLNGSVDLVAANNTVLCLVWNGTVWQETSRKVA